MKRLGQEQHTDGGAVMLGHSEKVAICKAGRADSEENKRANALILNF